MKLKLMFILLMAASAVFGSDPNQQPPVPETKEQAQKMTKGPYSDIAEIPDTPIGRLVTPLLEAINSNDPVKCKAFVDQHVGPSFLALSEGNPNPSEPLVGMLRKIYEDSQGLTFVSHRKYKFKQPPTQLIIILKTGVGDYMGMTLFTEKDDHSKLSLLTRGKARPPLLEK